MAGRKKVPVAAPARKAPKVRIATAGDLIRKLRKPLAPPTRVAEDDRKYSRARERERARRRPLEPPAST